jgi:metacaspase-1
MAKGLSIHVGLNSVDPVHYQGWSGELAACEFDAKDMEAIARGAGFEPTLLQTADASAQALTEAITSAAEGLGDGDMLFLTYSGHGGQMPDSNSEEDDRMDETWCLFDRQVVDDELYTLWSKFKSGVRILVLSDSCHSGTATRETLTTVGIEPVNEATGSSGEVKPRFRAMPEEYETKVYEANQELYDQVQAETTAYDKTEIPVPVMLISGCQDSQTSADGERNGLFTQTLRAVWSDGAFEGDYRAFAKAIVQAMPLWQAPNYFWAGEPNLEFERQRPFTL